MSKQSYVLSRQNPQFAQKSAGAYNISETHRKAVGVKGDLERAREAIRSKSGERSHDLEF